jgi:probable rRNA maturation factor
MTSFFFEDIKPFDFSIESYREKISYIIDNEGFIKSNISIILCSDPYLLALNKKHLNHDYFTDIITFSYNEENKISGDLFISVDRLKENAKLNAVDFCKEMERVVYHGVLHLCGYNDKSEEEIFVMRAKENYYLELNVSRET